MKSSVLDLSELLFELEESTVPAPAAPAAPEGRKLPSFFNVAAYEASLAASGAVEAFESGPEVWTAEDLSVAIFQAADAALPNVAAFVISSSTGKDSTLLTAIYFLYVEAQAKLGRPVRKAVIAIADTGSEFPTMKSRMRSERDAINLYAKANGLDLRAKIVMPPVKDRLIPLFVGNGSALPKRSTGKSSGKFNSASFCMDRVKAKPIATIIKEARAEFSAFAQCIGVRDSESAKRSATIARYSGGLPFGVSAITPPGSTKADGESLLGLQPIVHWSNLMLTEWIKSSRAPWRADSLTEMALIYGKAAAPNRSADECALTITNEGRISNSCGDLSGSRFGCFMCVLSKNSSLQNYARKDPTYYWLYRFHTLLYSHHDRNAERVKFRDATGFTADTLFPKGFLFSTRYELAVVLFRAEMESGFELATPEEVAMIETYWRKAGVYTVHAADAKRDALNWMESDRKIDEAGGDSSNSLPVFSYLGEGEAMMELTHSLSEGFPAGAYFNLRQNEEFSLSDDVADTTEATFRDLEFAHMVALSGPSTGTPLLPALMAYVMADMRDPDRILVMVSDVPSVIGSRTNTGLVNGLVVAGWRFVAVRPATDWEYRMADGRVFFYQTSKKEESNLITRLESVDPDLMPAIAERIYRNFGSVQGLYGDPLDEQWRRVRSIQEMAGMISFEQFKDQFVLVGRITDLSDILCDEYEDRAFKVRALLIGKLDFLQAESDAAVAFRREFRKQAKAIMGIQDLKADFEEYMNGMRLIARLITSNHTSSSVIARMVYLHRMNRYDEEEIVRGLADILRMLQIKNPAELLAA